MQRHRKHPIIFKQRGRWQQVNPSEWQSRTGVTVNTALARSDRIQRIGALSAVIVQQQQAIEAGGLGTIVTENHVYNALTDYVRATTLGDPTPYWQDPDGEEAQAFRQQQQQEAEEERQRAEQMQAAMVATQAAIEGNKELTKRLENQTQEMQAQREMLFKYQQLADELKAKYTQLELKYTADVPGEGIAGGAATAGASEEAAAAAWEPEDNLD